MSLHKKHSEKFKNAFEEKCFKLIIDAYQKSLDNKIIKLEWNENDITSEIHEEIKLNPLRTRWKISSNVESHIPTSNEKIKGFSSEFPRIDLRLTNFVAQYEFEYFFEAKNLKENDSGLKRRYIDTGIDNFVSEKYPKGSLVGYLLEGDQNNTVNGINSLLTKDKRHTETLKSKINKLHIDYYESDHLTIGILKHLIFDFTKILIS
jgi:hypothetical protein